MMILAGTPKALRKDSPGYLGSATGLFVLTAAFLARRATAAPTAATATRTSPDPVALVRALEG